MLRDASIIHCDLKPENILLASPSPAGGNLGQLKLIDFGSACFEVCVRGGGRAGVGALPSRWAGHCRCVSRTD